MRKLLLLAAGLALLTTACRIETNVILNLEADRSGTYTIEFGLDQEIQQALATFGGLGDETIDPLEGFESDDPNVESTRRTEGDMDFVVATTTFDDVDALQSLLATAEDSGIGDLNIDYEGTTVRVTGTLAGTGGLDPDGLGSIGDLGELGDLGDLSSLGFNPSDLTADFFSASLIIAMPGEIVEHNATRVLGDGSLQWDLPLNTELIEVLAVSDASSSSFPWWVVAIAVIGVLAIGLGLLVRRRKKNVSVQAVQQAQAAAGEQGHDAAPGDDPFISKDST